MRASRLLVALVVFALVLTGLGSAVVLAMNAPEPAVIAVLGLVVLVLAAASLVGGRSRRWRSNPYW